ncbi:MAG: ECF transporter S component [Bacilli bacterium]
MKKNKLILRITLIAMFTALAFTLSAFIAIPYPGGIGYFNLGDVITIFVSIFIGPFEGALVGMLSGSFADLFGGYTIFIPFTIVAKLLLGLIAGLPHFFSLKNKYITYLFPFFGGVAMALTYFISYYIYLDSLIAAFTSFGLDILQITIGSILGGFLSFIITKETPCKRYVIDFYNKNKKSN